ncbi:hypothetical protein KW800_01005 [Candidatus Parcubacteria bacterium]|nr:hypothetical protein [Candidatus Parcubacteria bacterium]
MEQDTDKLIQEQFKTLPQPVQRAISLTPWRKLTRGISIMNGLDEAKADSLETETMLIIYSFDSDDNFAANIARELGIDMSKAVTLAKEIEDKVFAVILAKATELAQKTDETLQSMPDTKPATQEIAPRVVVEQSGASAPSVNRIPLEAPPQELKLEPPVMNASKTSLAPANLPSMPADKPKDFITEKLTQVVASPSQSSKYPGGLDPYREPTN